MKKTILYISLFLFFSIYLSGCSLFSSNEDKMVQASGEVGAGEFGDDDSEEGSDPAMGLESSEDENMVTEEGFGSGDQTDEYQDEEYAVNNNDDEASDLPGSPITGNQEKDLFAKESEASANDSFSPSNQMDFRDDRPKLVPVKKMKSSVYQVSGVNINRLYVVRPGDNMQSIATKIYGSDRSEDLFSYNPHFKGKILNVGDKVYYQSPHNKNDSVMKTYYEDNNLQPQYYITQEGDNLRKFSKKFLGHGRSWMEIYATNDNIESKGRLPAGLQIRYWPDSNIKVAENPNPSEFKPEPMPAENQDQNIAMDQSQQIQPEENPDMENPENNNMDNMEEPIAQMGDVKNINDPPMNDDPPPAPGEINNQPSIEPAGPPPSPPEGNSMVAEENSKKFTEDDKLMAALCGLMFLVAIILLVLIRRNRSRKVNFGHTQS